MATTPTSVKKVDASNLSLASRAAMIRRILVNMKAQASGVTNAGLLLAGDPGTGKTSLSRLLAKLLGLNLIVVEIPHILEEHIINIPYLRYTPKDNKVKNYVVTGEKHSDFELVLAQSNLMTQLKDKNKIEDADYLKAMYSGAYGTGVRRLFELLGGSPTQIPRAIADVRAKFSTMLFLDEYFRKTSTSIRNMLRGVLNRRLGFDRLPDSVYVLFASNINDDGVEAIPHNNQFSVMDVNRPDKDAWFSYVTDRAEDLGIKLSPDVVNLFYNTVAAQEMPELDESGNRLRRPLIWSQDSTDPTGVRISPRRLEQMLHYVNASIPVKNMKAARALLTNMKQNFIKEDGDTDLPEVSETGDKFMADLVDLIKDSNPDLRHEDIQELPNYRWRDALHHQIMRKLKLGDVRTYIPVISGPFGIGKTTAMDSIATSLKLGQIYIDCSTLSAEDVTGTPLPTRDADGNESVEFADSKLYKIINQQAAEVEPEEATKNGFKFIIFFDELNRTNTKTFNALRKVILEKEFDNGKTLPKGSVVVAAINPEDQGGGVTELTSHMRDVMDIVKADPDWTEFSDWLAEVHTGIEETSFEVGVHRLITAFSSRFSPTGEIPGFRLELGTPSTMYMSPREYTQIFSELCTSLDMAWSDFKLQHDISNGMTAEVKAEADLILRTAVAEVFLGVLRGILYKNGIQINLQPLNDWFMNDPACNLLSNFEDAEIESKGINNILSIILNDHDQSILDFTEVSAYLANTDGEQIVRDVNEFVATLSDEELFDSKHPLRIPEESEDGDDDVTYEVVSKVSPIVFVYRELFNADRTYNTGRHINSLARGCAVTLSELVAKQGMNDNVYRITKEMAEENFIV